MHQPLSTSFASLVVIIVARLPDADLWLPFKSRWRKSMMRIFSPRWAWYGNRFRRKLLPGFVSSLGDCPVFARVDQFV